MTCYKYHVLVDEFQIANCKMLNIEYYLRSLTFIYSWACSLSDDSGDALTYDDLENIGFGDSGSGKGLESSFVF